MKNWQEQLRAFQTKRNEIAERQESLMAKASEEGRTLDEDESSEYDGLEVELKHVEAHVERLRKHVDGSTAKPVETKKGPTILVRKQDKDEDFEGQNFTRRVIAKALAQLSGFEMTASQVAEERWGKSAPQLVQVIKAGITKAAVDSGGTVASNWGNELVAADGRYTGDFINFLAGKTVYDQLALREVPAHVTIKGQDGIATGYWTAEHDAINVSAQDYSDVTLTPLKVGAISVVSKELLRHSSPAAEQLVRDALVEAIAQRIDTTFLGTGSASGGTPAGILQGVSSLGSNGYTADALRADIKELYAPFLTAKNAQGLVLVMTPTLAKAISLMVNALGQTEFPGINTSGGSLLGDPVVTGDNVGATHIILLKPSDIYKIGDLGIEVSLSMDATIEQDGNALGYAGSPQVAASATLMSMFQTESVAFKVVRPVNYAKRRSHAAQFIGDADYGDSTSTTA
jgi:HK97 family phage major capsid protein